jgi:hypothetical protein
MMIKNSLHPIRNLLIRFTSLVGPLLICMIITSCVGTVEEAKEDSNVQFDGEVIFFPYSGLRVARAISHNKIELEFDRYAGADVEYFLQINDSKTPIKLDPSALFNSPSNRLMYTVRDLNINTVYKFKISAQLPPNLKSQNENELTARTFDNLVSEFDGVLKLSLVPGNTSGGIIVEWKPVAMSGLFSAGPYDPVRYEVSLISDIGGAQNLNNTFYTGSDRLVRNIPDHPANAGPFNNPSSFTIENLSPGRTYYVQVRAINQLWDFLFRAKTSPMPVSRELNTKILSIKTEENTGIFSFNENSLILSNPPGSAAFNSVNTFWAPASGPFAGYKLVWRKYEETDNPEIDDKISDKWLKENIADSTYLFINSSTTSRTVSSLDTNSWYQFKIIMCKVATCPIDPADPNNSVISNMKAIRVQPTLAPFSGIHSISNPGEFSARDLVTLHFDSPILSSGFASVLEFYCVNPADKTQMTKFDGTTPISGSSISVCNGLFLNSAVADISTQTTQKVSGLKIDGMTEYCFAASPAILGASEVRLSPEQMIVRCLYPEIIPPNNKQFSGLMGSCQVNQTEATIKWPAPTGGVYSNFRVFWREKTQGAKFNFQDAINDIGNSIYFSSELLALSQLSYMPPNLAPGKSYIVGVLAVADMESPVPTLYSEFNSSLVECNIPLPKATFNGFTRVLALGPKVDGRIPNSAPSQFNSSSFLYEALNQEGIPYEVSTNEDGSRITSSRPFAPPGRDFGEGFASSFDGRPNQEGYAMSNSGIISLAWEEVDLDMSQAQSMFITNQASVSRSNRSWGYRVYRSQDNRLSWQLISSPGQSHNIYSMEYSYFNAYNNSQVTKRMSFFTDYSVQNLNQIQSSGKEIERGRVYFYRIVPVFNNIEISVINTGTNIIKVTLPPPNMALVHRWMANRAGCIELRKDFNITQNYSCEYAGLGSRPATIPHQINFTILDQGADLLVDRFELGCRYTRGDPTDNPRAGLSNFQLNASERRDINDQNYFPLFKGWATYEKEENASLFKGCSGQHLVSKIPEDKDNYNEEVDAINYAKNLHGDCLGNHRERISTSSCSAPNFAIGRVPYSSFVTPGVRASAEDHNCSEDTPSNPTILNTRYSYQYSPNLVMQSEPLAVFHNGEHTRGYHLPFWTPAADGTPTDAKAPTGQNSGNTAASCWINLSAVDGSGYVRPRWLDIQKRVTHDGQPKYLLDMTVAEALKSSEDGETFYNGIDTVNNGRDFRVPSSTINDLRISATSTLARIMTSNSSKLPPIGGISYDRAVRLCHNYHVQVGFSQNGTTFVALESEKRKRPLARSEFITVSQWPEAIDQSTILQREQTILSANNMCNNSVRNVNFSGISVGGPVRPNQFFNSPRHPLSTGSTGSERGQSNLVNTHLCTSRFGIQDLVGNSAEFSAEQLFCDYSQDNAFIGRALETWSLTNSSGVGEDGPQIPIATSSSSQSITRIHQNARFRFRNDEPDILIKPHVQTSTDSGYCSLVDKDSSRRNNGVNPFRDVSGIFRNIYNANGSLNTLMIPRANLLPEVLSLSRNGDGRFLDLGPNSLAPALRFTNSLNLRDPATALGKYFNPILGISLTCNKGSCEDTSLELENLDNVKTSIDSFTANRTEDDSIPEISNFFIGNSNFSNPGMSNYQITERNMSTDEDQSNEIIEEIWYDDSSTYANQEIITKNLSEYPPSTSVSVFEFSWQLGRERDLMLLNGGHSNHAHTGRFSGQLIDNPNNLLTGVRCAVRINEE